MTVRELLRAMGDVTLLDGIDETALDAEAAALCTDSRAVVPGAVFVAISGFTRDARSFAAPALAAGALVVVGEGEPPDGVSKGRWFPVESARRAAAKLSAAWHGYPSHTMDVYAVTGTNGKTTIATLLHDVLNELGNPCGLLSTVETDYGNGEREPSEHTTPDPVTLHAALARIRDNGCRSVCMEVSSQALDQRRTDGMLFAVAAFTNLTRDHLDYHGDMEAYYQAKLHLFELLGENPYGLAVINLDDPVGPRLVEWLRAHRITSVTYGLSSDADLRAVDIRPTLEGTRFRILTRQGGSIEFSTPLLGRHNVLNLLAIFGMLANGGYSLRVIAHVLSKRPCVRGRLERVPLPSHPATWFVDYAHTPDALEHVLDTLRETTNGRIAVVFGCGGDRDKGKRPQMGRIAAEKADIAIVTSDNPRSESPEAILEDIRAGIPVDARADVRFEIDRAKAIALAAALANAPGDAVLVAGKGHETGQIFADHTAPFDDHEAILALR